MALTNLSDNEKKNIPIKLTHTNNTSPREYTTFWLMCWRVSLSIRLQTMLNHIRCLGRLIRISRKPKLPPLRFAFCLFTCESEIFVFCYGELVSLSIFPMYLFDDSRKRKLNKQQSGRCYISLSSTSASQCIRRRKIPQNETKNRTAAYNCLPQVN